MKDKAREIAARLRTAGFANARATDRLVEAVRLGALVEDCLAAARDGEANGAGDPFAYGMQVLVNRMRARPAASVETAAVSWEDAPRSIVESRARDVGIKPWDEGVSESWTAYKARVGAALAVDRAKGVMP